MSYLGNTYNFKDLPAYDINGKPLKIHGRYTVEEYQPYEPAAGIPHEYFVLIPENADDSSAEVLAVTVDPYDLEFAIEPEEVERREAQEREREWEEEQQIAAEAEWAQEGGR